MKKSFKIVFLILILMSSFVFAQTQDDNAPREIPVAVKFDEFEKATNGYVKMKMDLFFIELNNNPSARGSIINYGTDRAVVIREKQIRDAIAFRNFDGSGITFVSGGFSNEIKTQFWLVPAGAEDPKLEPTARKFDNFEEVAPGDIKARMDGFFTEINNSPNAKGYLINYGTNKKNVEREQYIKTYIKNRRFDASKIDFAKSVNKSGIKTVLWIVPEGVELPKP